jgi:hypothetical protein
MYYFYCINCVNVQLIILILNATKFINVNQSITNLFRNTNINVAYKTSNTIKHLNCVYQMKCKDCPLRYVGQRGRTFRTRYNKHMREIQTNLQSSKFGQHILDTVYNYDTMYQTMKILHVTNVVYINKHLLR